MSMVQTNPEIIIIRGRSSNRGVGIAGRSDALDQLASLSDYDVDRIKTAVIQVVSGDDEDGAMEQILANLSQSVERDEVFFSEALGIAVADGPNTVPDEPRLTLHNY